MLTTSRMTMLAGVASLSVALAIPIATTAYADDESEHEAMIKEVMLLSQPAPVLTAAERNRLNGIFKVGQNDAFGAAGSSVLAPVPQGTAARLASTGRTIAGKIDVVGAGGAQDALAVDIYHPGSGTDW